MRSSSAQYYIGVYTGAAIPGDADLTLAERFGSDLDTHASESSVSLTGLTAFFSAAEIDAGALQLIGGVRVFLNDNVALFGEYKYVKADFGFESLELDYEANQVYGGIEFYFGPGVKKFAFGPPPPQWP